MFERCFRPSLRLYSHMHTDMHATAHTYAYRHVHSQITHSAMQIHTYTCTHPHKHIRIHTYALTRLLEYTIAYAHARNLTIPPERMYIVFGREFSSAGQICCMVFAFRIGPQRPEPYPIHKLKAFQRYDFDFVVFLPLS